MCAAQKQQQPLYDKLVELLREKITNEMEPGDPMPTEREISELYGISRTTVRLALARLEKLGVVTRQPGERAVVASPKNAAVANLLSIHGFTEQMGVQGKVPTSRMLEFKQLGCPRHVAVLLNVEPGDMVWRIRRLRLADGVPLMVERTYLPGTLFPELDEEELTQHSLYNVLLDRYNEQVDVVRQDIYASIANNDEAALLEIPEGAAVLRLAMVANDAEGKPIEYTRTVARADQFRYSVTYRR